MNTTVFGKTRKGGSIFFEAASSGFLCKGKASCKIQEATSISKPFCFQGTQGTYMYG